MQNNSESSQSSRDNMQDNRKIIEHVQKLDGQGVEGTIRTVEAEDDHGQSQQVEIRYGGVDQSGNELSGYSTSKTSQHVYHDQPSVKTYGSSQVTSYTGPALTSVSTATKNYGMSGSQIGTYGVSGAGTYGMSTGGTSNMSTHRLLNGSSPTYSTSGLQYTTTSGGQYTTTSGGNQYLTSAGASPYIPSGSSQYLTTGGQYTTSGAKYTSEKQYEGGNYISSRQDLSSSSPKITSVGGSRFLGTNSSTPAITSNYVRTASGNYVDVSQTTGGLYQSTISGGASEHKYYQSEAERTMKGQSSTYMSSKSLTGKERLVSERTIVGEERVISEKYIEVERMVPKKVYVEEIMEKVVVIPEKRVREEIKEEWSVVREKVIEVAKPIIQEKIIEVPEYVYVDKIVEVPEIIIQEKIREVTVVDYQERIVEVPRIIEQEKIVEVQEIEYVEVPVERIEEVFETHEQIVVKEIPVPQYVDKPYPEYVDVEESLEIVRNMPVPVEAIATYEFKLPRIRPFWKHIDVPLYVPRFVELPVPMELAHHQTFREVESYAQQIAMLGMVSSTSLCEIENLAKVKQMDFNVAIRSQNWHAIIQQMVKEMSLTNIAQIEAQFHSEKLSRQIQLQNSQYETQRFAATSGGLVGTTKHHTAQYVGGAQYGTQLQYGSPQAHYTSKYNTSRVAQSGAIIHGGMSDRQLKEKTTAQQKTLPHRTHRSSKYLESKETRSGKKTEKSKHKK